MIWQAQDTVTPRDPETRKRKPETPFAAWQAGCPRELPDGNPPIPLGNDAQLGRAMNAVGPSKSHVVSASLASATQGSDLPRV